MIWPMKKKNPTGPMTKLRAINAELFKAFKIDRARTSYPMGKVGKWSYVRHWLVGWILPGGLPIEELLFFVVVPVCAILTLEAVRRRRPNWRIGDEPADQR